MKPHRVANLLGALSLLLAAAGCAHTVAAPSGILRVGLTEYRLMPQSVRTPQGELRIFVHNYGRLTHNLAVTRGAQAIGTTRPIRPGQTGELVVEVTPGKYLMLSTLLTDRDLGIYGTLTVTR